MYRIGKIKICLPSPIDLIVQHLDRNYLIFNNIRYKINKGYETLQRCFNRCMINYDKKLIVYSYEYNFSSKFPPYLRINLFVTLPELFLIKNYQSEYKDNKFYYVHNFEEPILFL